MSLNKYKPHVFVLPEDDANRGMANGFIKYLDDSGGAQIRVLPSAGGWGKVVEAFKSDHVLLMGSLPERHFILRLDFDEQPNRFAEVRVGVPDSLADRVFIIGTWSELEKMRAALRRRLEDIGTDLARECRDDAATLWNHELLRHNAAELKRMTEKLKPILFPAT